MSANNVESANPMIPIQVATQVNMIELTTLWGMLKAKLSADEGNILTIQGEHYRALDDGAKAYLACMLMSEIHEPVLYARDGNGSDHVYLGTPRALTAGAGMLVNPTGASEALWMVRPEGGVPIKVPRPPNAYIDRNTLAQNLIGVSVEDLLVILPANTLRDVATQLHQNGLPAHEAIQSPNAIQTLGSQDASVGRAKRPLNAFMAFRTYYLNMFPDIQQKTVSGFLTTLWNKEAQRNKWALIAKVYSFARDHLGKGKVNLAAFLALCCPIMCIIDPADYLDTLGWVVQENPEGAMTITRADNEHSVESTSAPLAYPTSELELLIALVDSGYLPEHGPGLVQLMRQNNNGMMTIGVNGINKKKEFIDAIVKNPYQAAEQILGPAYDHAYFQRMSIYSWEVIDLRDFSFVPITIPYPPTGEPYPFHDDGRPGVPTSMPFDAHLTPSQRAHEQRLNEVAGAWDMDDTYVIGYIAEINANGAFYDVSAAFHEMSAL